MGAERGSAFLLKIGDGAEPPAFSTVAGLKTTQLSVNGDPVAITNKDSGGWLQIDDIACDGPGSVAGPIEIQVRQIGTSGLSRPATLHVNP